MAQSRANKKVKSVCTFGVQFDIPSPGAGWVLDLRWIGMTEHAKCPERQSGHVIRGYRVLTFHDFSHCLFVEVKSPFSITTPTTD